jgi:hypothetical protein
MYKKGDLLKHKTNGRYVTIVQEPYTKLFRDAQDIEASRYGFDCGIAATAIRIIYHEGGYEKTYKKSIVRKLFIKITEK